VKKLPAGGGKVCCISDGGGNVGAGGGGGGTGMEAGVGAGNISDVGPVTIDSMRVD
jgi:hypothetical protein